MLKRLKAPSVNTHKSLLLMLKRHGVHATVLACCAAIACARELPDPVKCVGIAEGGCPSTSKRGGDACLDPACSALYVCNADRSWTFELAARCWAADASLRDAAMLRDVSVDAPPGAGGGPGCESLVSPDCTLLEALSCAAASCCGCEDIFICENGGWSNWGSCASGAIVPNKR
jgi:hypothetical protein